MVTPVLNDHLTDAERLYNEAQVRTRNVVERQYGVWKQRFPILHIGIVNINKKIKDYWDAR